MKTRKIFFVLCVMLMMGLYSGVLYANDSSEGHNIESTTIVKNDKQVEILQSQDHYLQITQIGQNSQSVKVSTSTFDERILISGTAKKGTNLKIEVYQGNDCSSSYDTSVGITETFSQILDILEGNNKVLLYYTNSDDGVNDYVSISIRRESAENMEKLKTSLYVPSL